MPRANPHRARRRARWCTMTDFFTAPEQAGMPVNVVQTVGHTLAQIARETGKDPWDSFFHARGFRRRSALPHSMSEANVVKALRCNFISFCTDMGPLGSTNALVHPRGSAAFPRILGRYVRELEIVPLERAIAQMTSVAANELKLYNRGRIAPGLAADLVVFDANRVRDRSTFVEPNLPSEGIAHVLVNGQFVIERGKTTAALPGRVLRRQGSGAVRAGELAPPGGVPTRRP